MRRQIRPLGGRLRRENGTDALIGPYLFVMPYLCVVSTRKNLLESNTYSLGIG
jgi:hypothetical protein